MKDLNSLIKDHLINTSQYNQHQGDKKYIDGLANEVYSDIIESNQKYRSEAGLKKAISQKAKQIYLKINHGNVETIKSKDDLIEMIFKSCTYSLKAQNEKHLIIHKCSNTHCPIIHFNPLDNNTDSSQLSQIKNNQPTKSIQLSRSTCTKCISQIFDNPSLGRILNDSIDNIKKKSSSTENKRSYPSHIQKHLDQNMKSKRFNFNNDYQSIAILYMLHLFDNSNNFIDTKSLKKEFNTDVEQYRTAGQVLFNMGYIHQHDLSKIYETELNNGGLIECIKGVRSNREIGLMITKIHAIKKKIEYYENNRERRSSNYESLISELKIHENAIEYFSNNNQSLTLKQIIKKFRNQTI